MEGSRGEEGEVQNFYGHSDSKCIDALAAKMFCYRV